MKAGRLSIPEGEDPPSAANLLHRVFEQLAPRDRLVRTLRYLEQCDVVETSRRTGWTRRRRPSSGRTSSNSGGTSCGTCPASSHADRDGMVQVPEDRSVLAAAHRGDSASLRRVRRPRPMTLPRRTDTRHPHEVRPY
jgi:hypothetical protein